MNTKKQLDNFLEEDTRTRTERTANETEGRKTQPHDTS
jgi:hypothetical protein